MSKYVPRQVQTIFSFPNLHRDEWPVPTINSRRVLHSLLALIQCTYCQYQVCACNINIFAKLRLKIYSYSFTSWSMSSSCSSVLVCGSGLDLPFFLFFLLLFLALGCFCHILSVNNGISKQIQTRLPLELVWLAEGVLSLLLLQNLRLHFLLVWAIITSY